MFQVLNLTGKTSSYAPLQTRRVPDKPPHNVVLIILAIYIKSPTWFQRTQSCMLPDREANHLFSSTFHLHFGLICHHLEI